MSAVKGVGNRSPQRDAKNPEAAPRILKCATTNAEAFDESVMAAALQNRKCFYGLGVSTVTLFTRRVDPVARCKSARALL